MAPKIPGADSGTDQGAPPGATDDPFSPLYGYKTKKNALGTKTTSYTNPAGLGETLGRTVIQGVWDVFGTGGNWSGRGFVNKGLHPQLTADQAMWMFEHAAPAARAQVQQALFMAGLYPSNYQPVWGSFTAEDKQAFKHMLIGLASSPGQGKLGDYLGALASAGAATGVSHHMPLVAKLTNPQDIVAAAQKAALDLNGTYMPDDQLQAFVKSYQAQELGYQTDVYTKGGYNPVTGQQDPGFQPGTEPASVVQPPSPDVEAANAIRYTNPGGVAVNEFKAAFMPALLSIARPAVPIAGVQ